MVGHHFLEQCVSRNLHQQYHIVVFGEERYAAYDRVHLSEYLPDAARSRSRWSRGFFRQHGIELRLKQTITAIDRDAQVVRDARGMKPTGINWCWRPAHTRLCRRCRGMMPGLFCLSHLDDLDRLPRAKTPRAAW
jgi:nitrite reductase (NADH) large subunit